jgi:hypothetical protein
MVGYDFMLGHTPISTKIKLLKENRPQGTIGWLQLSFPLWIAQQLNATERTPANKSQLAQRGSARRSSACSGSDPGERPLRSALANHCKADAADKT